MRSHIVLLFITFLVLTSAQLQAQEAQSGHGKPEPPMAGVHWAKGQAPKTNGASKTSPLLTPHGGDIMPSVQPVQAIFWGLNWGGPTAATFTGDKITGIDTFYGDIGNSAYSHTCSEYSGPSGTSVGDSITYNGHSVDTSPAVNGSRTGPILAEVCKEIKDPQANGYYPVYVDLPRGHANFCAWHSAGFCGTVPVQFAFFFNLDGDPGCDPGDDPAVTGHSQGLAALANVSGHEISEARTDPRLNAWYDSSGNENADKCAWTFGSQYVTFTNGTKWKIQGNWSNAAYTNSPPSGYPNEKGQPGCIDGGNFK